jgi:hypothetical protein
VPGNLWRPADGPEEKDFGAHGRFDDRAKHRAVQPWASHNRPLLALAAASLIALRFRAVRAGTRRAKGR